MLDFFVSSDFIVYAIAAISLTIFNIFTFYPLLLRFLIRDHGPMPRIPKKFWPSIHYGPTCDIPGVPEHYDYSLICLLRTLPEPSDYVGAFSDLPVKRGLYFTMKWNFPKNRYSSITLYPGFFDTTAQDCIPDCLADYEIKADKGGNFTVLCCSQEQLIQFKKDNQEKLQKGQIPPVNWINTQGITDGLLVFRRYLVTEGSVVFYPTMRAMDNDEIIIRSYKSVAGPFSCETSVTNRWSKAMRLLKYNFLIFVIFQIFNITKLCTLPICEVEFFIKIFAFSMMNLFGLNYFFVNRGTKRATDGLLEQFKYIDGDGDKFNLPIEPKIEYGKNSARPHPKHKYWVICYDTLKTDVEIKGLLPKNVDLLRFWSLCVYGMDGIPLTTYFNQDSIVLDDELDENLCNQIIQSQENKGKSDRVATLLKDYKNDFQSFSVTLRNDKNFHGEPIYENEINVGKVPKGAVLVRVIYPQIEDFYYVCKPMVNMLNKKQQ